MSETDDRLSHARQLLKKYQNKRHQPHENGSSSTSLTPLNGQGTPNNLSHGHSAYYQEESGNESAEHDHSYGPSEGTSRPCSTSLIDGVQRNSSFSNYPHFHHGENESAYLRQLLQEKDQNLNDVTAKLQALHTHYAELHNAYNLLSQSLNAASPEYAQQISQLQTALSVAIEEKTTLQSELRVTLAKLQEVEAHNLAIQDENQRSSHSSTTTEIELNRLYAENKRLSENVINQSAQIEAQRKECSNLEAKILMIQQDRNDTQARLKNLYAEKENMEKSMGQLTSELNMKEIYIRQLTRHSSTSNQFEDEKTIRSLSDEKSQLAQELEQRKFELLESQREMSAIRQHYESCMRELNENVVRLETELNTVATVKKELQSENYCLQTEIDSLKAKLNVSISQNLEETTGQATQEPPPEIDSIEVQALRNSLTNLQSAYEIQSEKIEELSRIIETKNAQVANLEETLFEARHEIENLRQAMEIRRTIENDVALLSEQLQNERATVSRAVAQNLELKEQLGELQDKLVSMANESAQREDEKHTAMRTIQRLKEQIEEMNSNEGIRKETYDQDTQTFGFEHSTTTIREIVNDVVETVEEEQQTDLSLLNASIDESHEVEVDSVHTAQEMTHAVNEYANHHNIERADNSTQYEDDLASINLDTNVKSSTNLDTELSNGTSLTAREDYNNLRYSGSNLTEGGSLVSSSGGEALSRHEMLKELETRLEKALQEKEQFKITNDRLEYWLAALETENETIGEYISIYRFQRNLIQKRLSEKDALIAQLQQEKISNQSKLDELHLLIHNLMSTIHQTSNFHALTNVNGTLNMPEIAAFDENSNGQPESAKTDSIHKMLEIISDLKARQNSSNEVDPLLHCTECKGKLITL